jgi:hypothetical protein
MVANTLNHCRYTTVTDSKAFACNTAEKNFSIGCSIQYSIAN